MLKKSKFWFSLFFAACVLGVAAIFTAIGISYKILPTNFQVVQGSSLEKIGNLPITGEIEGTSAKVVQNTLQKNEQYTVQLKLFGLFPVSKATVSVVNGQNVQIGGDPFGIKLYTQGVLIVGLSDIETQKGVCNPAKSAGLKTGDILIRLNDQTVSSNAQVSQIVEQSGGQPITVIAKREEQEFSVTLTPVLSATDQKYRAGIWVRDSSAGIGTLTFYDPSTNILAGLGHGICDVDTGEILPIASGQMVGASILNVRKGEKGAPGELLGCFSGGEIAEIVKNSVTGVYGVAEEYPVSGRLIPVAMKQEVKTGQAQIVATVSGKKTLYDCTIERVHLKDSGLTQNMVIRITDEDLLQRTGGIVQGMSGSPILQNGKLIGAITHVLVDDPTRGYGIFAENMLDTAQSVANAEINKAS